MKPERCPVKKKVPLTPVKVGRAPVKLVERKPIIIAKDSPKKSPITDVLGDFLPPQRLWRPEFIDAIDVSQITDEQLAALQHENFALWVLASNIEVDHHKFSFEDHKYLLPMYMDTSKKIVLMKAAQMGATIWMMLRLIHFCVMNKAKACLYFPTMDGVGKLSKDRLAPMIGSNPELSALIQDTDTIGFKKIGKHSSLYLQHMGGEATKDSTPFDMLCFDEVRLLNPADIDQARERLSHSSYKYEMQVSTAGYPNCFPGYTKVIVKCKRTKAIVHKSLNSLIEKISEYRILSYMESPKKGLAWRDIDFIVGKGRGQTIRVYLDSGESIVCTPEHPFAQITSQGEISWKPISSFKEGEFLLATIYYIKKNKSGKPVEVLPQLSLTSVKKISPHMAMNVYDLGVKGYPAFFLAETGCMVHNSDIHKVFLGGTQNYWHVRCNCSKLDGGFIPSDHWPDCIAVTKKEIYLQCPRCRKRIADPQDGRYIPHNPGAPYPSYHISQLISKYISPAEIWDAWQRTQNLKEFYNAKLGLPYVDKENQPIKPEDCEACENPELRWEKTKSVNGIRFQTAMGVDQMSGNNYVVIVERHENKKRIVHLEIIDAYNPIYADPNNEQPFKRIYQIMQEWDIDLCIIDAMPNINEAMKLAKTFPRRVFVAHYIESQKEMVQWADRPRFKITVRKGGPNIKFKFSCFLARYTSIDYVLNEIANRNFEWPLPERLIQICRSMDTGLYEPIHIARTHFYKHLQSVARQKIMLDEDSGRFKMDWINLGIDPHYIHAVNLANIAIERLRRVPILTFV